MAVEQRLHLKDAFWMRDLLEPSTIEQSPSKPPAEIEPEQIPECDARPGRHDRRHQRQIAAGDLPTSRGDDEILGQMESDAGEVGDRPATLTPPAPPARLSPPARHGLF